MLSDPGRLRPLVTLSEVGKALCSVPVNDVLVIRGPGRYHRSVTIKTAVSDVGVDEATALAPAAALFRSLGDPSRLAILRHLALGEHRVRDLTDHLGLAQSTVSAHCRCLVDCGLITSRPRGRATVHTLARPELLEVLAAAERLLAANGDQVALCPTSGSGHST